MKKVFLIGLILLATNFSSAQTLQKGNLLGLHIMTVKLNSNVTMDEFMTFYISKVIPEFEKNFQGAKGYLIKGVRGESNNSFGIIWHFETEQSRDKFFEKDGNQSELGKEAHEKTKAILKELEKLGTYTTKFTDWVIQ